MGDVSNDTHRLRQCITNMPIKLLCSGRHERFAFQTVNVSKLFLPRDICRTLQMLLLYEITVKTWLKCYSTEKRFKISAFWKRYDHTSVTNRNQNKLIGADLIMLQNTITQICSLSEAWLAKEMQVLQRQTLQELLKKKRRCATQR